MMRIMQIITKHNYLSRDKSFNYIYTIAFIIQTKKIRQNNIKYI